MPRALDTTRLDAFIDTVDLYMETGVLVELDHFLKPEWSYTKHDAHIEVEGPDDRSWLPGVRRLIHVLAYTGGSLHRKLDDGAIELISWREKDGRGFRVIFRRRPASSP